ncbi:hypothetical protein BKA62DRAFT_145347 [Auriculariales sp. MPI-PUGE-AT-0066]|nr:hypothetical protein BKA62DRAFT_145347 [Auriculariales sp. MPI-PUGE-AT-0066]
MTSAPSPTQDFNDAVRHSALTGWQIGSLVTPILSVGLWATRRGRGLRGNVNFHLRSAWVGSAVGTATGAGLGYARYSGLPTGDIRVHSTRQQQDALRARRDDYAKIGAFLGAVLGPAIFFTYGPAYNLVLGGSSLGCAIGTVAHVLQPLHSPSSSRDTTPRDAKTV